MICLYTRVFMTLYKKNCYNYKELGLTSRTIFKIYLQAKIQVRDQGEYEGVHCHVYWLDGAV